MVLFTSMEAHLAYKSIFFDDMYICTGGLGASGPSALSEFYLS